MSLRRSDANSTCGCSSGNTGSACSGTDWRRGVEPELIAAMGGILATLASLGVALRQTHEARRLATLNSELQENLARLNSDLETDASCMRSSSSAS